MEKTRIAIITDIHFGYPYDEDMEEYMVPSLETIVEEINEYGPEFVVVMGDFLQHDSREQDFENLERINEVFNGLETPWYAIPGNHDVEFITAEELIDTLDCENDEPYFSLDVDSRRLLFLDTTQQNEEIVVGGGYVGREQLEWIDREVDAEMPLYVFSHHLLHDRDFSGSWFHEAKPELAIAMDKKPFLDSIEEADLRAVFSAHIHETGLVEFRGAPHLTLWAMDKFNPPEKFPTNWGRLELNGEGFRYSSEKQEVEHHS